MIRCDLIFKTKFNLIDSIQNYTDVIATVGTTDWSKAFFLTWNLMKGRIINLEKDFLDDYYSLLII